jgi:hypothetical protein
MLGLDGVLPVKFESPDIYEIVKDVGKCFPNHKVYIFCSENQFLEADENVSYCGDYFVYENIDDTQYAIGFVYSGSGKFKDGRHVAHFVVGQPVVYNEAKLDFCVMVKEGEGKI